MIYLAIFIYLQVSFGLVLHMRELDAERGINDPWIVDIGAGLFWPIAVGVLLSQALDE